MALLADGSAVRRGCGWQALDQLILSVNTSSTRPAMPRTPARPEAPHLQPLERSTGKVEAELSGGQWSSRGRMTRLMRKSTSTIRSTIIVIGYPGRGNTHPFPSIHADSENVGI